MMRSETKATARSTPRSSSSWRSGNVGYGLILGFLLVLLYLIVSAQFSYNPNDAAYAGGATTINAVPAKRQRIPEEQDVGGRGMEEERRGSEVHTEPSMTVRLKEEQEEGAQVWADKNPIEEQSGNERNSDNWKETHQPKENDTVEFTEFGGGTDDFNNVAHAKPICDTSFGKYDICELSGDVRARGGGGATVTVISPRAPPREWRIKPYSRKYLDGLKSVTVRSVPSQDHAPPCTTRMNIPAMVIELGGLTGNYWHDFTDVLVPLFIGARRFNGEVQLLVVNLLPFWVDKYRSFFNHVTRHEIVDFDNLDDGGVVRCYPHVTVGYGSRKEFTIDPATDNTGGDYTMVDFTKFLRQAYSLPRHRPIKLRGRNNNNKKRPRMMIFERTHSRKFLNLPEVVAAAEAAGFDVTVAGRPRASYDAFAREVNSFDVMLGVHGAGLTNCVYLPTGAVLVQVVPYGKLEGIARTDFGDPARDMGLRYIEYSVAAEESSLMDVFGKDHPIVRDPVAVHLSGWGNVAEWYLGKQDVRINIQRFTTVLNQAMEHLQ